MSFFPIKLILVYMCLDISGLIIIDCEEMCPRQVPANPLVFLTWPVLACPHQSDLLDPVILSPSLLVSCPLEPVVSTWIATGRKDLTGLIACLAAANNLVLIAIPVLPPEARPILDLIVFEF